MNRRIKEVQCNGVSFFKSPIEGRFPFFFNIAILGGDNGAGSLSFVWIVVGSGYCGPVKTNRTFWIIRKRGENDGSFSQWPLEGRFLQKTLY